MERAMLSDVAPLVGVPKRTLQRWMQPHGAERAPDGSYPVALLADVVSLRAGRPVDAAALAARTAARPLTRQRPRQPAEVDPLLPVLAEILAELRAIRAMQETHAEAPSAPAATPRRRSLRALFAALLRWRRSNLSGPPSLP